MSANTFWAAHLDAIVKALDIRSTLDIRSALDVMTEETAISHVHDLIEITTYADRPYEVSMCMTCHAEVRELADS